MLPPFNNYNTVFIEITKSDHQHGGAGWEFSTCLWSPSSNKRGHDRYSLMRKPQRGDLVLHFYDSKWVDGGNGSTEMRLCGYSLVSRPFQIVKEEPPTPGIWGGRDSYYRIDLRDYTSFQTPLPIQILISQYGDEIRKDIIENKPRFYPFNTYGHTISTVQGIYLAQSTSILYNIISRALGIQESLELIYNTPEKYKQIREIREGTNIHEEYTEARRRTSERYFFSRNPSLARAAKQMYGTQCQACGFDFEVIYGEIGKGYIEAHHLNPLSERAENEWTEELKTTVDEVTVLCANCHRIIHRRRPALSLDELRAILKQNAKS